MLHDVGSTFTLPGKLPVYLACPKAHLTHAFLSCDTANDCEATHQVTTCPYPGNRPVAASTVVPGDTAAEENTRGSMTAATTTLFPTFQCVESGEQVHFTQVCNFWNDCTDGSDESFCQHVPCTRQFTCGTGQCVPYRLLCDNFKDCLGYSDEIRCQTYTKQWWTRYPTVRL